MARPTSISDDQILDAARAVFLEQGFGATTATIAERAGVSEGSIFKRYASKDELFLAALGFSLAPAWFSMFDGLAGTGEVAGNLREAANAILAFFREHIPRMMLVWSARAKLEGKAPFGPDAPPVRGLKALQGYLEQEVALGRVKKVPCDVLARMMLGSLLHFVFFEVHGMDAYVPMTADDYVDEIVRTMCCRLGCDDGANAPVGREAR